MKGQLGSDIFTPEVQNYNDQEVIWIECNNLMAKNRLSFYSPERQKVKILRYM